MAHVNDQFTPGNGNGHDIDNTAQNEELEAEGVADEGEDEDETQEDDDAAEFSGEAVLGRIEDAVMRHPLYTIGAVFAAGLVAGKCISMLTTPRRNFQLW